MVKRLAVFVLFFHCTLSCFAQTVKTDVLVIGAGPAGVAAAIQCARSRVKTILVEQGDRLCPQLTSKGMTSSMEDGNYPGGFWSEFKTRVIAHYRNRPGYDTNRMQLQFEADTAATILAGIADTVKNLTIHLNTSFVKIVKDDDRWDVTLMSNGNKQVLKARVVIDATAGGRIMHSAGGSWKTDSTFRITYRNNLYRTSVGMGDWPSFVMADSNVLRKGFYPQAYFIPVKAVFARGIDNLLVTGVQWKEPNEKYAARLLRNDINLGQGAGVTAAYCAFFKTTTAHLNIRAIQGELLDFKGGLLPVNDISNDPYWRAIQQVCATGMLKPVRTFGELAEWQKFNPDSIVTTAEIKPVMLEIYTRAFIWFNKEKPAAQFTVANLLSFISEITLTDQDNLQKRISDAWADQYHFKSDFDLNRPITRREFAILANRYLNPFARTVDLDGRVVN
jgi:hypothetical protein